MRRFFVAVSLPEFFQFFPLGGRNIVASFGFQERGGLRLGGLPLGTEQGWLVCLPVFQVKHNLNPASGFLGAVQVVNPKPRSRFPGSVFHPLVSENNQKPRSFQQPAGGSDSAVVRLCLAEDCRARGGRVYKGHGIYFTSRIPRKQGAAQGTIVPCNPDLSLFGGSQGARFQGKQGEWGSEAGCEPLCGYRIFLRFFSAEPSCLLSLEDHTRGFAPRSPTLTVNSRGGFPCLDLPSPSYSMWIISPI